MKRSVAISIADQGVLSLFNLALNAWLVATASPMEFGHYVFAVTVVLVATSIQNAMVATPISVVYPSAAVADRAHLRGVILDFDRLFRWTAGVAAAVVCLTTEFDPLFVAAAAALTIANLARETERNLALAEERTDDLLRIDGAAVLLSCLITALLWPIARPSVAALAGTALGSILAVAILKRRTEPISGRGPAETMRAYGPLWRDTRWSLAGAATTEVQNRAYVFMLEIFRTARDLADVQAGRLLMGPLPLIVGAWGRVARPRLARLLATGDVAGMRAVTLGGLAAIMAAGTLFALVLWLAWPMLERLLFRGRYPGVATMTALWTVYTLLMIAHMVLSAPLVAAMRLKELSRVTMATSMLSVLLLLALATSVPSHYAVAASIVCEAIALVWIGILVRRLFQDLSVVPLVTAGLMGRAAHE